jgi:flagellar assembly factor FliW
MITDRKALLVSKHFGSIEWDPASELLLPFGLPGFEDERRMIAVEVPAQRPLVYLQSVDQAGVCFVSLPVRAISPGYELNLNEEDRAALLIEEDMQPEIGTDVLCLGLLFPGESGVVSDLGAPVVINLHNLRCVQSHGAAARHYRLGPEGRWEPLC